MCGILLQNQIGALLVVPAMVGALQPELASALALHGALCEVGWELQDAVVRIYDILFCGEDGKCASPPSFLSSFSRITSWYF